MMTPATAATAATAGEGLHLCDTTLSQLNDPNGIQMLAKPKSGIHFFFK